MSEKYDTIIWFVTVRQAGLYWRRWRSTGERGRVCVSFSGYGSPGIIHKGRAVGWQQIKIML